MNGPNATYPELRLPAGPVPAYADLEIRILERQAAGYPVEMTLDSEQEFPRGYLLPDLLSSLAPGAGEGLGGDGAFVPPDAGGIELGERLFDLLFAEPCLRDAWAETRGGSPRRRVRLWIDPRELQHLPWELLPSAPGKPPLSLTADRETPFSRYVPCPRKQGRLIAERPLKALVAIASPRDLGDYQLPALDLEGERRALASLAATIDDGRLQVTFLEPPITRRALLSELQQGYHLLHLVAHGGSRHSTGEPGIYLADDADRADLVSEGELTRMVEALGESLRLIFLASCHSATGCGDRFQGLAPSLVAAGVPAVMAMRGRVPVEAAQAFALAFYRRLEAHGQVDLAANEARGALLTAGGEGAVSPVLYMRLRDGVLFVPTQPAGSPPGAEPPVAPVAVGPVAPDAPAIPDGSAAPDGPDRLPVAGPDPEPAGRPVLLTGVDGATGEYFHPVLSSGEIARRLLAHPPEPSAQAKLGQAGQGTVHLGEELDPRDLASAGWGVIFARDVDPAVQEALEPLLRHRRRQAGARVGHRFRELAGEAGLRPGESKVDFLQRLEIGHGPADPDRLPYYLLLVGGPDEIPYELQSQLDVQYAVGRLCLGSAEAYRRYAEAVVAAETAAGDRPRRATFFGVENPGDRMSRIITRYLVQPIAERLRQAGGRSTSGAGGPADPPWQIETILGEEARKARLAALLSPGHGDPDHGGHTGAPPPAFLFTASHGVAFRNGHPHQLSRQGALLCADWAGPEADAHRRGVIPEDCYLCADDVPSQARLDGLISFHFACYGAGTPRRRSFAEASVGGEPELAPRDFVARLPRRLLEQGALAVVGHVDRAWGYSFLWQGHADTRAFEQACQRLLEGHPVGSALDAFHRRYAELTADLVAEQLRVDAGKAPDAELLTSLWTASQDARNYVILGDPAVRLP